MVESLLIEVAYALPDRQEVVRLSLPSGSTVWQAVEASGLLQVFPDIDRNNLPVGIFSRLAKPDTVLRDRDRVEIYRPLLADPKEIRRKRAAEGKGMKKGVRSRLSAG